MTFSPRSCIPGLPEEAQRALAEVQTAIARECKRLDERAGRPKRRTTELVEEGHVIAKPGEVVRVQPGDEDVTVILPDPATASDGEDIVVSFEGDGTAPGKVRVEPMNGTCLVPGVQVLNAPGSYRFTATGAPSAKPRPAAAAVDTSLPGAGAWAGPPAITTDDLPPIDTSELVDNSVDNSILDDMPANSVKVNATGSAGDPTDLTLGTLSLLGRRGGNLEAISASEFVPSFFPSPANLVLRVSQTGTNMTWGKLSTNSLVDFPTSHFLIRDVSTTGPLQSRSLSTLAGLGLSAILDPNYNLNVNGSTSVVVDFPGTNEVQRAALTGDVTAAQNSNATAFRSFSPLSVLGRSAGTSGIPTEIAATASSEAVLHEALGSIAWGQVTTGGYADGSITDAKITNRQALSLWGRAANSVGAPADISTTSGSATVMRESGGTIGWGTVATAGLADDSVTNAKLAEMVANTVKANATASTANPTDFAVGTNTVLGRVAANIVAAQLVNAQITDGTIANAKLANMAPSTIKGRARGAGTGAPADLTGEEAGQVMRHGTFESMSLAVGSYDNLVVAETTQILFISPTSAGDVNINGIAHGSSNAGAVLTICKPTATGRVIIKDAQGTSSAVNRVETPRSLDYTLTYIDEAVVIAHDSDSAGRWRLRATRVQPDAVGNIELADVAAGTQKGRQIDGGTGDVVDLTGSEQGENLRLGLREDFGPAPGTYNDFVLDARTKVVRINPSSNGDVIITGFAMGSSNTDGFFTLLLIGGDGRVILVSEDTGSAAANRILTPGGGSSQFVLTKDRDAVELQYIASRWTPKVRAALVRKNGTGTDFARNRLNLIEGTGITLTVADDVTNDEVDVTITGGVVSDGDKGDVTVSSTGTVWTIDNNVVSNAKLRDSGALSVIGRSANSSGDPADISAATNDRALVRRSNALVFDQIITADIADGVITVAKLAGIGANTILGNDTAGTLTPNAIAVGTNTVLGRVAGNIVAAQLATGQIANNAITDGKLRQSAGLSVIGRIGSTTGDVGDITAVSGSGNALREVGGTLGFGTLSTGAYGNSSVTNAKLAQMAQSTIKGRAEGAGTGDPGDLTPTQVAAIIDGEAFTWTAAHNFNGVVTFADTVDLSGALRRTEVLSTGTIALDNLALSGASVLRLTGNAWLLTGMDPNSLSGRDLYIVNAHTSSDGIIFLNSGSSSSSNQFAGIGTSRVVRPGEFAHAWYDGVDSKWRLLCRDETDL